MTHKIQMPDLLIPGPLAYSKNAEALLVANSKFEVESYSFDYLQMTGNEDIDKMREELAKSGKTLQSSWVANLGEEAR